MWGDRNDTLTHKYMTSKSVTARKGQTDAGERESHSCVTAHAPARPGDTLSFAGPAAQTAQRS